MLDLAEISGVQYVCTGSPGASGSAGANGTDGTNGTNGLTALVSMVEEASGSNCTNGGKKINVGLDANLSGVLDLAEVSSTSYVCNGAPGAAGTDGANGTDGTNGTNGLNSLLVITPEMPNVATCEYGGSKVVSGVDNSDDGTLGAAEVASTQYVCNGAPGLPGANGTSGTNGTDGTNGVDGLNSLISITAEAPNIATCQFGGNKAVSGLDSNRNDTLDLAEITSTQYVCNGAPGAAGTPGTNGLNSLIGITPEPAGANCTNGGIKTVSGLDANSDGTLDLAEISSTHYVCNGAMGPGGSGSPLSGTTASIGGAALANDACASGTAAVPGATTSMVAEASPVTYPGNGFVWYAYVSAANTVTVRVCNLFGTNNAVPAASAYNVRVLQ